MLNDERKPYVDQVSIKARAFVFTQEGVNQYTELLTNFKEDVRTATVKVNQGKVALEATAAEGRPFARLDPKPTPMQERYLVIQLLKPLRQQADSGRDRPIRAGQDAEHGQRRRAGTAGAGTPGFAGGSGPGAHHFPPAGR